MNKFHLHNQCVCHQLSISLPLATSVLQHVGMHKLNGKFSCMHSAIFRVAKKRFTSLPALVLGRAWLGTILACISVLPKEDLKRKILTLAISKGQLSQTVTSRQTSCRIVGEIANRFGSESMWWARDSMWLNWEICGEKGCEQRDTWWANGYVVINVVMHSANLMYVCWSSKGCSMWWSRG